jgi:hypothetical protein
VIVKAIVRCRCRCRCSSDLALVRDGRDLSSALSDRQGDCLVLVVLCSVPVPRPVFSPRSARFTLICAVLRSSPVISLASPTDSLVDVRIL